MHDFIELSGDRLRSGSDEKTLVKYGELDEEDDEQVKADGGSTRSSTSPRLDHIRRVFDGCPRSPCQCSARFHVALLSSIGFCISFGIRCNMGLAVLQMTSNVTRWSLAPILDARHSNLTIEMVS